MKAVGSAITVVLELIMLVFEYSTWKTKLKQQISKGVRAWKEETVQSSLNDLEALRQENIKNIREIAAEMDCYFTENNTEDIDELKKAAELSQAIGTEIGAL
jgi:CO dehydrogenase/acetyl-CoA synthase gamma subunit (corrinoid Fe-S protein)